MRRVVLLAMMLAGLGATPLRAQSSDLPIFDTHIHYSAPDWASHPPERVLDILARAGIQRALVSSTPDDGTLALYEKDPGRIVPMLRPYRTWSRKPCARPNRERRTSLTRRRRRLRRRCAARISTPRTSSSVSRVTS